MRKPLLMLAAAAAAVVLSAPASAVAATYPPDGGDTSVTNPTPAIGDVVTVSAGDYRPGSDVNVTVSVDGGSASGAAGAPGGGGFRGSAVLAATAGDCQSGGTCTVVASASGTASAGVEILEAGTHTVTFTGVDANGQPLTQSVTLDAQAADDESGDPNGNDEGDESDPDGGVLSDTGAEIATWTLIGVALVAVGALVVVASRRRSGAHRA